MAVDGTVPVVAAPTAVATEDEANDVAEAIDTFSSYRISPSLPPCILKVLCRTTVGNCAPDDTRRTNNAVRVGTKIAPDDFGTKIDEREVIELLDDDYDKAENDGHDAAEEIFDMPSSILSHTSPACESALLSSVQAPQACNEAAPALTELAISKALSPLQLEGACLAIQRHQKILIAKSNKTPVRAGFFLGDAAGVGKGRQIAAVVRDSLCRGRTRHLWVSVSRELCRDAQRDLTDLGCHVPVWDGTEMFQQQQQKSGHGLGSSSNNKGVLFVTYALLIIKGGKRMDDMIQWLTGTKTTDSAAETSFDGVIVFDEAHKAKNLAADTHTAKLVIALQKRLPMARILYCSATGVSDISHMIYANRLMLWGPGTLFSNFAQFSSTLSNRGTGSLELLALEMKQMGTFIARTLSWDGAEFQTLEIGLDRHQVSQYNQAVTWWMRVETELKNALQLTGQISPLVWRNYWSAHQRFFREMCICAKVGRVVQEAKLHLEQNCAVVIGLQTTGEAGTHTALSEHKLTVDGDAELNSLMSTSRSIMTNFIRNHFPLKVPPLEPPRVPPLPPLEADAATKYMYQYLQAEAARIKSLPPPEPLPVLLQKQSDLISAAKILDLPPSPLDDLIDQLGGEDQVAELTGRSGRILRDGIKSSFRYCKRIQESSSSCFGLDMPKSQDDCDKLNIVEKKKFMDGRKSVAIISDAASTGISLHAAFGSGAAQKRRVHFTIEVRFVCTVALHDYLVSCVILIYSSVTCVFVDS